MHDENQPEQQYQDERRVLRSPRLQVQDQHDGPAEDEGGGRSAAGSMALIGCAGFGPRGGGLGPF